MASLPRGLLNYRSEELERWLMLRSIEWETWPAYLAQLIGPVLFIFFPVYWVIVGILVAGFLWRTVRYPLVSVHLSWWSALIVQAGKWPISALAAVVLALQGRWWAFVVVIAWTFLCGLLGFTSGQGQAGIFNQMLADQLIAGLPGTTPSFEPPSVATSLSARSRAFAEGRISVLILERGERTPGSLSDTCDVLELGDGRTVLYRAADISAEDARLAACS